MYKAKVEFLWYKQGEEIKESDEGNCSQWAKDGLVELSKPVFKKVEEVKKVKKAVKKGKK